MRLWYIPGMRKNSVTIVAGCPGSGKTTLSSALAGASQTGVHVVADEFYRFLSHRIDPTTAASHIQNTTVTRSLLAAARTFADSGYDVYVDGVLGPRWLATISGELHSFEYVILHADLDIVLQRTVIRAKATQASATPAVVRIMHEQFDGIIEEHSARVIDTTGKPAETVRNEFIRRQLAGDFL